MNKLLVYVLISLLAGGVVGFLAGSRVRTNNGANLYQFRRFGSVGNERPVRGQIISNDKSSITIKLSDGSTKIVLLPGSANILQTEKASASAIKKDEKVVVTGTENSDGSITAQDVQLIPIAR